MMFSPKKVDDLRARERKREEKGTTNSAPLVHAMKLMNTANQPTADQKNNLVFYGLEPEPLEIQMEKEPEFCRDILETRIKMIFRETLKISRDIPFVTVYRFTTANADPDEVRVMISKAVEILGKI